MVSGAGWDDLEVAKLAVGALTPLTVALIGIGFARVTRRVEASQWVNQKLIEKRIALLDEALPQLNSLYCYLVWVGDWKDLSPPEILSIKRRLDRLFYANRPFFSGDTLVKYEEFMEVLFKLHNEPGTNARLRTGLTSRFGSREENYTGTWQDGWARSFAPEAERTSRQAVMYRHELLLSRLGEEVGVEA